MDIRVDARYYISTRKPINRTTKPTFKGKLEETFYKEVRAQSPKAYRWLTREFDVLLIDKNTGNNFLHYVCNSKNKNFFKAGYDLIKSFFDERDYEKLKNIFDLKNKEGKLPLDYLSESFPSLIADTYLRLFSNIADVSRKKIEMSPIDVTTVAGMGVVIGTTATRTEKKEEEKVGNEVDEEIDLGDFEFGGESVGEAVNNEVKTEAPQASVKTASYPKKELPKPSGVNAIVGHEKLKNVFEKEIIRPLKNNKNVFTNGFLVHGLSGTGKTYVIEKLAEELDRQVVTASSLLEKRNDDKLFEQIEKSIIKVNPDNLQELIQISDLLKDYFNKTNKQGFVFVDEMQKFFPEEKKYINNVRAIQSLEDSAKNGMILLATTRELDSVDQTLLNSLRFERIVELKMPRKKEILELIQNNVTANLSDKEIEIFAKKLNGFSFNDIVRIIGRTQFHKETPILSDYEDTIKAYAQEHSMTGLTDEGTTSGYDTFIKRVVLSDGDPKSLDEVAGMKQVKSKLKKVFDPIKKDGVLKNFLKENKVKKPNGILLYGPPGCGKTYIMTALSAEVGLPMYQVKLSDIGSSLINGTEKNLKKVFDQLRKKYRETGEASILFFDECDSFFSKSTNDENRAVLNTLKEEMNNAGEDGIYVVAATNEKDNLNTAIVRDGRFDTKIEVGYPDEEARIALIAKSMDCPALVNNKVDETIKELARLTAGLSNASIAGIFSTIKYEKASTLSEDVNSEAELYEKLKEKPIELDDIKGAITAKKEEINKMKLKSVDRTGLEWQAKTAAYDEYKERVYYTKEDPKSLNDVIGMEDVKRQMILKVLAPLNPLAKKLYEEEKLPLGGGIILHGPGGVGKTFIVRATAAESKIPLYEMKISEEGSSFINKTANNIQNIFNQLKRKYKETGEPSILFLDECDSLLGKTSGYGGASNNEKTDILNTLKQELATAQANGIVVLAATNNYNNLDPVVTRSGRFNNHIKIDYPDEKARMAFLIHTLKKRPSTENLCENQEELNVLVKLTAGMSNADIKTAVENAVIASQESYIRASLDLIREGKVEEADKIQKQKVTFENLKEALSSKSEEIRLQRGFYEN